MLNSEEQRRYAGAGGAFPNPPVSFPSDDSASAASSMEVTDRIASLEQRVQMQEDEIQLLKSALADVVRRLNASEEQQAMGSRRGPTKSRIFHLYRFFYSWASNGRNIVFFLFSCSHFLVSLF